MNQILKILLIGGFILIRFTFLAISQETIRPLLQKETKKRWEILKNDLSNRNILMITFLTKIGDSLNELKTQISRHTKYIRKSKIIDSVTVQSLSKQTDTLDDKYELFINLLIAKKYFVKPKDLNSFLKQWKIIEDQLIMSKQNYNDMIDEDHKLYFQMPPSINVRFPL
jgi:hypothetical protein